LSEEESQKIDFVSSSNSKFEMKNMKIDNSKSFSEQNVEVNSENH